MFVALPPVEIGFHRIRPVPSANTSHMAFLDGREPKLVLNLHGAIKIPQSV